MKQEGHMTPVTLMIDKRWLKLLGELSRHQEGFVWLSVGEGNKKVGRKKTDKGTEYWGDL